MHGGAQIESQRYKLRISQVSCGVGALNSVQVCGLWMRGGHDGAGRSGQDLRGGSSGGRSRTMINGVDVLDMTPNFTADEFTSLGWNGGREYVARARERMNGRGRGGRGRGHNGGS